MKISIKAEGSSTWEDLNFLTEDTEIEYIRVDDFLISPQTLKVLNKDFTVRSGTVQKSPDPEPGASSFVYGIVDLVGQHALALHGPVQEVLGYPPEILQALPFLEYVHPDDRDATKVVLSAILQGKHINEFVLRIVKPDGDAVSIKMSGTPADRGILAFYCLPTPQVRPSTPNLVHGYFRGELTGRSNLQFIAEQDHGIFQDLLRDILSNRGAPSDAWDKPTRYRRVQVDGELIEVENFVLGADFPKGRIHLLERVPANPDSLYHFLYDMLGNVITCRSASDLAVQSTIPQRQAGTRQRQEERNP
tara:strand:+ start:252 stop:1166 length:915 start_codon:yes stop_codon:yes gene_type:complete